MVLINIKKDIIIFLFSFFDSLVLDNFSFLFSLTSLFFTNLDAFLGFGFSFFPSFFFLTDFDKLSFLISGFSFSSSFCLIGFINFSFLMVFNGFLFSFIKLLDHLLNIFILSSIPFITLVSNFLSKNSSIIISGLFFSVPNFTIFLPLLFK